MTETIEKWKSFALILWNEIENDLEKGNYALAGYGILIGIFIILVAVPIVAFVYIPLYLIGRLVGVLVNNNNNNE